MQTLDILSEKISLKKIIKKKALYHASEDEIIRILKQTGDNYKTLLLINHEPSMSELINRICLKENSDQFENLKRKFPTAAVAEVNFNFNDWERLSKVKGKLISFIKPKDLQASKE
jgi:Phosphohistidine phosphatase SixA